jgi:hypothetical protein
MTKFIPKIEFPTYDNLIIESQEKELDIYGEEKKCYHIYEKLGSNNKSLLAFLYFNYEGKRWKKVYAEINFSMIPNGVSSNFILALKDLTSLLDFLKERGLAYSSEEVGEYKNINQYL